MKGLPLQGKTIFVTRARSQASVFTAGLEGLGARVVEIPTIRITPLLSAELDSAIREISSYDWLFFTSVNGVNLFFRRVRELGSRSFEHLPKICSIGPATAEEVRRYGLKVDLQPQLYQAEGIIEEFSPLCRDRSTAPRILLPRAKVAREILPEKLRELGAEVDVIPVYETITPPGSRALLVKALDSGRPDLITFTSSSTVKNFIALAEGRVNLPAYAYAAIGPVTAGTAEELGLRVVLQSRKSTIPDFIEAIREYFSVLSRS